MIHYRRLQLLALMLLCTAGATHALGKPAHSAAVVAQAGQPQSGINLTMEHRHTLKELLLKESKVKREPAGAQFEPGATVPATIELHHIPQLVGEKVPQIKNHSFVLTNDAVVIVGTQDRKVVDVVRE